MKHNNDNQRPAIVANSEPLRFLSVCSGIEAASQAWPHWHAVAFSEIEKFPSAVLAHHYPDVPNLGDFTKIDTTTLGRVDILCGGTPCQAFSVAGKREGLADARGNLTLSFVELAHELADGNGLRNVVWENVPGVLSSRDNAFGCFLAGLVGADAPIEPIGRWTNAGMVSGPKGRAAWRVLDAQYFGVAQRRRRVIVVADFGNGADPAAVLLIEEGVRRDTPPSREKGEGVAGTVAGGAGGGGIPEVAGTMKACAGKSGGFSNSADHAAAGYMVPVHFAPQIARCDATREGSSQDYETTTMVAVGVNGEIAHTLKAEGADASEDGTGRGTPIVAFQSKASAQQSMNPSDVAPTLDKSKSDGVSVLTVAIRGREGGATAELGGEVATALRASQGGGDKPHVLYAPDVYSTLSASEGGTMTQILPIVTSAVRRLTPVECERLQGFPEIKKQVRIEAWKCNYLDLRKNFALVGTPSRKSRKSALSVGENGKLQSVNTAPKNSSMHRHDREKHVALNVRVNLERTEVELSSAGKSNWSVNIAEGQNESLLPMPIDDFVRLIAHICTIQDRIARSGKEASHQSAVCFSHHGSGSRHVVPFGRESDELASDAGSFIAALDGFMRSITLGVGQNSLNLEQTLLTSLSFATSAISLCIPREILDENSFDLNIEAACGYTAIPWRGKPAEDCPDGPRYKALGNSWAVPLFTWLGRRIDKHMPPLAINDNNKDATIADAA